ncbi:MAG TPA: LysR family transcriptional regulator [Candidatus Angelobacter sp.]|nr:LysR family transcriptional regulator [Candidatus Angelobacter sp.]
MEIHQLRYFCAIVKHGTFTRAAESVYVAQPSLSQQILKLEDELGGKLFYRLPRAARLTPLGEFFLPHALAILQEISDSKTEARKIIELRRSETMLETEATTQSRATENAQGSATENLISKLPKSA